MPAKKPAPSPATRQILPGIDKINQQLFTEQGKAMTQNNSQESNQSRLHAIFSYIIGFGTATLICLIIFIFIGYKARLFTSFNDMIVKLSPTKSYKKVMRLPDDILLELTRMKAPIENANNPTNVTKHQTYLTHLDDEMGYLLNADTTVVSRLLKSTKAINVDPPVLHLPDSDTRKLSPELQKYLQKETRLSVSYSINSEGLRKTVPEVESDRKILIIGDSVPFGVGVDDENTMASRLQQMVGDQVQIVNGGVGGYSGHQAFLRAKQLSDKNQYIGLIYIACQNDFMGKTDWTDKARNTLSELGSVSERFDNNVMVILETYMEYNLRDFFLGLGWSDEYIDKTHQLRKDMPGLAAGFGFAYHDWTDTVQNFMTQEKSIFSSFALYSDHAHLSPLGNRLMAGELFNMIKGRWNIGGEAPKGS